MIVAGIDPSLTNTGIAVLADGNPLSLRSIGHGTLSGHSYAHRADCTTELARRERDRSGRARCDCCGDKTPVKSLRWDRYRWQCAACAGGLIGAGNGA
ncbi:hypothetical protein [Mycobacterium avium]|uniref:hypothetical protein n=1 Tax=Mycobacterium avium TaxID=1764 RepID=UPI001CC37EA9|nr:hypothetical protein [Mycobacterium avium]MBZ4547778.1 hypothetical protein [Mycobacterium avium subsp. hominissuis]